MFLAYGARIGYWRGSIEGVAEDLQVAFLSLPAGTVKEYCAPCSFHDR